MNYAEVDPGLARVLMDADKRQQDKQIRRGAVLKTPEPRDPYHRDQSQIDEYQQGPHRRMFPDD